MIRPILPTLAVLAAMLASGPAIGAAATHSRPAPRSLFGTEETRSDRIEVFPKWRDVLDRAAAERAGAPAPCAALPLGECSLEAWDDFLGTLRGKGRRTQIAAVNAFMNRHRYVVDPVNYGVADYWAAPGQFFSRDGDCEDYAIAKFLSLRALGFDNDTLRVVVLQDLNLGIAHAVLAVYLEDEILILDNQVADVVPARTISHYRPIYSVNETHWWLHRS
jgi:predicted transglutaminase-like cysteine proteinase